MNTGNYRIMSPKRASSKDEKQAQDDAEVEEVYCVCKTKKSEMDEDAKWIACDNPDGCPVEWFHIGCVGLRDETVPEGEWFCEQCKPTQTTKQVPVPIFICEICEEQFTSKEQCLKHKQEHLSLYQQSMKEQNNQQGTSQSSTQKVLSWEQKSTFSEERATDPMSPQGNNMEEELDNQSSMSMDSLSRQQPQHQPSQQQPIVNNDDDDWVDLDAEKIRILSNFSDEEIIAEMASRKEAFICCCGIVFEDQSLYYLHKGCHNTNNPRKCSFCGFEANDWYDFTSHFFVHKNHQVV